MTILVVMADGSNKVMPASIDPEVIKRLGGQIRGGHIPGLPGSDFEGAGGLNDLVDSLPLERKTRFYLEPVDPAEAALAREVVLIGLDVVGIFDPTPFTDGASGLLSLSQGDFIQAGFSIAGLIPVGEPVKWAGKIQRLARFVDKALDYAKRSPEAAARVAGWLRDIANGMDSVKGILPQSVWDQLAPIRKKIDDFLTAKGLEDDAVEGLSSITRKVKRFEGLSLKDQMKEYGNLMKTYQKHLEKYGQKAGQTMGETNRIERELAVMRKLLEGRGRVFGPNGILLQ